MSEAQAKANEKYRKANVKSFNVKFFPADADVLTYFQAKENRNQYIKDLIRKDMERSTTDRQDVYLCVRGDLQPPRTHRYLALRGRPPGLRDACCVPVPGDEKRGLGPSSRCAD